MDSGGSRTWALPPPTLTSRPHLQIPPPPLASRPHLQIPFVDQIADEVGLLVANTEVVERRGRPILVELEPILQVCGWEMDYYTPT